MIQLKWVKEHNMASFKGLELWDFKDW